MAIRRIAPTELPELLKLYAVLHPEDPLLDPAQSQVHEVWNRILGSDHWRYYVAEHNGRLVATCTLSIIPNLTRGLRPYGLIENVVTHPDFRRRGFATAVLRFALAEAWGASCYKVLLESGAKEESTLQFYEQAGFKRGVKTGFVAYPA